MNQEWWLRPLSSSRKEIVKLCLLRKYFHLAKRGSTGAERACGQIFEKILVWILCFSVWFLLQGWDGTKGQLRPTFSFQDCLKTRGSNLNFAWSLCPPQKKRSRLTSGLAAAHQSALMKPLLLKRQGGGAKPVVPPEWRNNYIFNKNATLLLFWVPWIVKKKKKKDSLYI